MSRGPGAAMRLGLLALVVGGLAIARAAGAVPVPDSAQLAELSSRLGRAGHVRVIGGQGDRTLRHARVDAEGIRAGRDPRPALVVVGTLPGTVGPLLRWEDIERVQVGHPQPWLGAIVGAAAGAFAGTLINGLAELNGSPLSGADQFLLYGISVTALGGAGALIGYNVPRWETVYDARPVAARSAGNPGRK